MKQKKRKLQKAAPHLQRASIYLEQKHVGKTEVENGGRDTRIADVLPLFEKTKIDPMRKGEFGCGIRFVEFDEEAKASEQSCRRRKQISDDRHVGAHD